MKTKDRSVPRRPKTEHRLPDKQIPRNTNRALYRTVPRNSKTEYTLPKKCRGEQIPYRIIPRNLKTEEIKVVPFLPDSNTVTEGTPEINELPLSERSRTWAAFGNKPMVQRQNTNISQGNNNEHGISRRYRAGLLWTYSAGGVRAPATEGAIIIYLILSCTRSIDSKIHEDHLEIVLWKPNPAWRIPHLTIEQNERSYLLIQFQRHPLWIFTRKISDTRRLHWDTTRPQFKPGG